ncbi:hypothetical protein Syun_011620 [Stephania yunnanensis]|uniref:Uncharacterized protein n=1 Tax=Stephania yunnanensis TaxID=152371 RepID=A0AAP0JYX2_9MAGN
MAHFRRFYRRTTLVNESRQWAHVMFCPACLNSLAPPQHEYPTAVPKWREKKREGQETAEIMRWLSGGNRGTNPRMDAIRVLDLKIWLYLSIGLGAQFQISTINLLSLPYWISRLVIFSLVATLGDHGDGGGPGEGGDLAGYRCKWATESREFYVEYDNLR